MYKKVINAIQNSNNIAILTHISPDPDAFGSSFATKAWLNDMGKKATVYIESGDEPPKKYEYICDDYVVFDGEKSYEHDLCLCLDCGDEKRLGERISIFNAAKVTVNIDHHITNNNFAQINLVKQAGATGEILYKLMTMLTKPLTKRQADCLYFAISSDTGSFKYSSVTDSTFEIAAELMRCGADNEYISRTLFEMVPMSVTLLKAKALSQMQVYEDGKIAIVTVSQEMMKEYGVDDMQLTGIAEMARSIEGVEVAVAITEKADKISISMRASNDVDVSAICLALGGGGHKKAAGASLNTSLDEAQKTVVEQTLKFFRASN